MNPPAPEEEDDEVLKRAKEILRQAEEEEGLSLRDPALVTEAGLLVAADKAVKELERKGKLPPRRKVYDKDW